MPYLRAGLDVDGSDISPDMLALARERARREGLAAPNLYAQAMHELDLPRRYRTDRRLRRVRARRPVASTTSKGSGGSTSTLSRAARSCSTTRFPYADGHLWKYWLEEGRSKLPRPWRDQGDRRTGSDGTEYELRSRLVAFDPLAQLATIEMKAAIWRDGERVVEEEHELRLTLYFTHEIVLMLEAAGFVDDRASRRLRRSTHPTGDDAFVVFIARKPTGER